MKILIDGMTCNHCKQSVEKALSKIADVESYKVYLEEGYAEVTGNAKAEEIINAIEDIGFDAKEEK